MLFLGDIHGDLSVILNKISKLRKLGVENQNYIQVGDFGVGCMGKNEGKKLKKLNDELKQTNSNLYIFRGNHDNPNLFNGKVLSNITFCEDYSILNIENKKIVGIGGAISIDRVSRKINKNPHWDNENVIMDLNKLENIYDIDVVVTHSAPDYCFPINVNDSLPEIINFFSSNDEHLKLDLLKERRDLSIMMDKLKENNNISHHFYGHFHNKKIEDINGCKHILLNINEFYNL